MNGNVNIGALPMHRGTIPILGLNDAESTAIITNLIVASTCMGALGWELINSISFDFRLFRETNWRSKLSAIHSLSYYLSRYSTLAFVVVYVVINATSSAVASNHICQSRVTAAATMFVLSECSVLLVFIMRTVALWNLDWRINSILLTGWLATFGLSLALPIKGSGVLYNGFCSWQIEGQWVGISMVTTAVTCTICLIATIVKLNKRGWRGFYQSMIPSASRSIDAEDVSRVLVQRTTLFFSIMILSIIVGDIVYFTVDFFAWKLMAVPLYLTISSNMAGKIFRKSWKMTHSVQYNMPPSYFPSSWHDSGAELQGMFRYNARNNQSEIIPVIQNNSRNGLEEIGIAPSSCSDIHRGPPLSPFDPSEMSQFRRPSQYRTDDIFSFVEGVFRSTNPKARISVKSLSLPTWRDKEDKTPAERFAAESRLDRRASEPAGVIKKSLRSDAAQRQRESELSPIDRDAIEVENQKRHLTVVGIAEAPSFVPRATRSQLISRGSSAGQSSTGGRGSSGGGNTAPPPFGSTSKTNLSIKSRSTRRTQRRPTTDPSHSGSDDVASYPAINPFHNDNMTARRDDLALVPSKGRLWLDSGAERARMEAHDLPTPFSINSPNIYSSSGGESRGSSIQSPTSSVGRSRKSVNAKQLILERATEAGEDLAGRSFMTTSRRFSSSAALPSPALNGKHSTNAHIREKTSRSSFLASPAIISPSSWSDKSTVDFDAMQRSLLTTMEAAERHQRSHTRPRTAPDSSPNVGQIAKTEPIDEVSDVDSEDLVNAFRQAVDEDVDRTQRTQTPRSPLDTRSPPPFGQSIDNISSSSNLRPRTSRGSILSSDGGPARFGSVREGSNSERPRTRTRDGGSVKPFGFGDLSDSTRNMQHAEEQEFKVESNSERKDASIEHPLERITTRSTVEDLM
jgi:hypothetical protein